MAASIFEHSNQRQCNRVHIFFFRFAISHYCFITFIQKWFSPWFPKTGGQVRQSVGEEIQTTTSLMHQSPKSTCLLKFVSYHFFNIRKLFIMVVSIQEKHNWNHSHIIPGRQHIPDRTNWRFLLQLSQWLCSEDRNRFYKLPRILDTQ